MHRKERVKEDLRQSRSIFTRPDILIFACAVPNSILSLPGIWCTYDWIRFIFMQLWHLFINDFHFNRLPVKFLTEKIPPLLSCKLQNLSGTEQMHSMTEYMKIIYSFQALFSLLLNCHLKQIFLSSRSLSDEAGHHKSATNV